FPFVRHRQDIGAFEMEPRRVARCEASRAVRREDIVTQPLRYWIIIELLAPKHFSERLTHNEVLIWRYRRRNGFAVKIVGFAQTRLQHCWKLRCEGLTVRQLIRS